MYNIIVLGCGRSGTSMVAGTLASSGYWTHENDYPGDESNPKGYYEENGVLEINEEILSYFISSPLKDFAQYEYFKETSLKTSQKWSSSAKVPPNGQRWLSLCDLSIEPMANKQLLLQMKYFLEKEPFCLKDIRFSYTLGAWKPILNNTKFVCIFRNPTMTIQSLIRYCNKFPYLSSLKMDEDYAEKLWIYMYKHILQKHAQSGDWLFIHYNQMFNKDTLDKLEEFVGSKINKDFPDKSLQSPALKNKHSQEAAHIYNELCQRANYIIKEN